MCEYCVYSRNDCLAAQNRSQRKLRVRRKNYTVCNIMCSL